MSVVSILDDMVVTKYNVNRNQSVVSRIECMCVSVCVSVCIYMCVYVCVSVCVCVCVCV